MRRLFSILMAMIVLIGLASTQFGSSPSASAQTVGGKDRRLNLDFIKPIDGESNQALMEFRQTACSGYQPVLAYVQRHFANPSAEDEASHEGSLVDYLVIQAMTGAVRNGTMSAKCLVAVRPNPDAGEAVYVEEAVLVLLTPRGDVAIWPSGDRAFVRWSELDEGSDSLYVYNMLEIDNFVSDDDSGKAITVEIAPPNSGKGDPAHKRIWDKMRELAKQ